MYSLSQMFFFLIYMFDQTLQNLTSTNLESGVNKTEKVPTDQFNLSAPSIHVRTFLLLFERATYFFFNYTFV